jgi:4-amino-4-deoxy-L-arabinose transferase-like glycosyltransferase
MNPFYPRIDWRRDTPGYVESELPVVPWIGACLYHLVGVNVVALRLVSCVFSLLSLIAFAHFVKKHLPPLSGVVATAYFAINPILNYLSTAIQPESAMICFLVLSFSGICAWIRNPSFRNLLVASIACSMAILAKSPAASVGLLLAYVIIRKKGWSTFLDWRVYLAGVVGITPPLLWSIWSHQFWLDYGNSLGLSNESHLIHLDLLFPPTFIIKNILWETIISFGVVGWILMIPAYFSSQSIKGIIILWYLFVWCFYVVAGGTSGDNWAYYYHCLSVPSVCLLMGLGVEALMNSSKWALINIPQRLKSVLQWSIACLTAACLIAALLALTYLRDFRPRTYLQNLMECSEHFSKYVPANSLIVVKGGSKFDEFQRPVAYNEPMVFTWMDRKGFNYAQEDLSLETLTNITMQGGRYWVMNIEEVTDKGKLASLTSHFHKIAECQNGYRLYDLTVGSDTENK